MEEEVLISLVENYEELYNLKHSQYSNLQRRENIWEEIGDAMKLPAKTCRERWSRIRENHRKALNLRKTKSGQAAKKMKAPKFEKELTFLVPYLFDEESRYSNIVSPVSMHSVESGSDVDETEDTVEDTLESQTQSADETLSHVTMASSSNRQKRKNVTTTPSAAVVLKEYLNKKNKTEETQEKDHLTSFFLTMADTVRGFPMINQIETKAQIFKIVNSVEIRLATDIEKQKSVHPKSALNLTTHIEKQKTVIPKSTLNNNSLSCGPYVRFSQVPGRIIKLSQNQVAIASQKVMPRAPEYDQDQCQDYEEPILYNLGSESEN